MQTHVTVAGQKAGKMVLCRRPKYAQDSSSNMNFHVVDYAADDDEVIVVLHGRHKPEVQLPGRKRERDFLLTLPLRKKLNVCIIYIFYFCEVLMFF